MSNNTKKGQGKDHNPDGWKVDPSDTEIKTEKKPKKSAAREWGETLIFALIVVPLINIFILQSYAIPTSSMEGSMLVGDKLFVSKFHYGARIPQTPLALPFMHDRIPFTNSQAYSELINLPYMRLPGFKSVKNGDIVVFNWPEGDTMTLEKLSTESYYAMCRKAGKARINKAYNIVTRPVDKRENYVKRCLAIGGDMLEIKEGQVYINNEILEDKVNTQYDYQVETKRGAISKSNLRKLGFMPSEEGIEYGMLAGTGNAYLMKMSAEKATEVEGLPYISSVKKRTENPGEANSSIFPHDEKFPWNRDNFGPIWIPKEGESIELTEENYILYSRVINVFEGNPTFTWKDGQAMLEGKPVSSYTFKMDYYWMMGDNRHNSQDSRYWGFVPEDHIVGTPIFVWLSTEKDEPWSKPWKKIRWGKSFRLVD